MNENKLNFSHSQILLNVPEQKFRTTRTNLSEMVFDQHHDFILSTPSPVSVVNMGEDEKSAP